MMIASGLGELYVLYILPDVLLMVLFLAILHTGRRLDERSRAAGAGESSLAWSAYAIAFLYPLADCISWVMTWADFRQYPGLPSLGAALPFLDALLVMLCLFLLPRRDRRSALTASVAAGASLLIGIATGILLWIPEVELRFWLFSPSWWVMRIFPALLIVGGYLALYRRRWAPLVLTASAVGALWSLWGILFLLLPEFHADRYPYHSGDRSRRCASPRLHPRLVRPAIGWVRGNTPIRNLNADMASLSSERERYRVFDRRKACRGMRKRFVSVTMIVLSALFLLRQ